MTPDFEGALALLAAILRQWAKDAQRDPHELLALAAWLDMPPAAVRLALRTTARLNRLLD